MCRFNIIIIIKMTLGTRLKELRSNEDTSNAGTKWTIDEDKNLVQ